MLKLKPFKTILLSLIAFLNEKAQSLHFGLCSNTYNWHNSKQL